MSVYPHCLELAAVFHLLHQKVQGHHPLVVSEGLGYHQDVEAVNLLLRYE